MVWVQSQRYDLNQEKELSQIPKCVRRRVIRIVWSTVPIAGLSSKRTRSVTCLWFMLRRMSLVPSGAQSQCCDVYDKQTASWEAVILDGNIRLIRGRLFAEIRSRLGFWSLRWMIATPSERISYEMISRRKTKNQKMFKKPRIN